MTHACYLLVRRLTDGVWVVLCWWWCSGGDGLRVVHHVQDLPPRRPVRRYSGQPPTALPAWLALTVTGWLVPSVRLRFSRTSRQELFRGQH